jgi:transcriptional regulator with XRE-family HTH domain
LSEEGADRVHEPGSPTVSRRRLAAELRRLRHRAGLTGAQAAEAIGASISKISRIESGRSGISQNDLLELLRTYEVSEQYRSEVLALAHESAGKPPVDEGAIATYVRGFADHIDAEGEAVTIWDWEPQLIPGLLQTQAYAKEVMRGWHEMFSLPPAELDMKVEARIARQHILARDQPPHLTVVIDESVLHRRFGDEAVMREQLGQLAASSNSPAVEIRVLALAGRHPIGTGSFTYMRFAKVHDVARPDVVVAEFLSANRYTDDVTETNEYRVAFEQLMTDALDQASSRDLIIQAASNL